MSTPEDDPEATGAWLQSQAASPSSAEPEDSLRLIEPIGRGGMAVVHRAVQTALGREVAVKRTTAHEPQAVAQFVAEAKITGLVEHANVIPVHSLEHVDGQPQIAMKLVKGRTFAELLDEPADEATLERHLRVLMSVAHAVAHAHDRGFIHRDIKPANIMLGEYGQVYLLDWGVAVGLDRAVCEELGLLHVEQVSAPAGTPGYMAPELASGDGLAQGPQSDVYLLGAVLHHILTGAPRHTGDDVNTRLRAAQQSVPVEYGDDVPAELAAIANRATAREPADRFPSVPALQAAIEAYLEHRRAHAITEEGLRSLEELKRAVGSEGDADAREGWILRRFDEAMFAFRHALSVWDGASAAREGQLDCGRLVLDHALASENLPLGERVLDEVHDLKARQAEVDELRAALSSRSEELAALRETARRFDWNRIGPALGNVFIAGGLVGASVIGLTHRLIASGWEHALYANGATWVGAALGLGAFARGMLRRVEIPRSLAAPRVMASWGAVGFACLGVGLFNELRPVKLAWDLSYICLLMGVGFVAMAAQTRRWLALPAVAFYAGALAIALRPHWGYEVLAAVWGLSLVGVGVALRRGVPLAAENAVDGDRPAPR